MARGRREVPAAARGCEREWQRCQQGIKVNPATTAWCAAFVNAGLHEAGIKGTGSLAAGSFTHWGRGVTGEVMPGDVAVVRGISPRTGVEGTHVGFLTGEHEMRHGQEYVQMLGGNQGGTWSRRGGVSLQWRPLSGLHVRRADIDQQMTQRVEATGKPTADVNAAKGTRVGAEGGGLFKPCRSVASTKWEPAVSSFEE